MALSAAEAGLGVAIADVVLADEAIRKGRLEVPINRAVSTRVSYFMVQRPELRRRRQVRLVEDMDHVRDSGAQENSGPVSLIHR